MFMYVTISTLNVPLSKNTYNFTDTSFERLN